jgi:carbon-monoxide dehydrogenase medium subunit
MVYQVEILSLAAGAPHQPYHQAPEGSVLKPAPFTYHVAHDVAEAVALLSDLGEDAKVLAGGQSLVPMMNLRLARPSALVDITRIPGLEYLRAGPDGLHVGALTRHRAVETTQDPAVLAGFGVLQRSARWIGHYPIRSRGTFGGSVAHGDSTAEWCILAVLLGAQIILAGPGGQRQVGAGDFFEGFFTIAAEHDEVITEVWFPASAPHAALTEFAPRQGDFATVAAAVSVELASAASAASAADDATVAAAVSVELASAAGTDGTDGAEANGQPDAALRQARIVLGGVSPAPFVVDATSRAGQPAAPATWREAGELAAAQIDPPDDESGDARYRRRLTATLVSRALAEASRR